MDALGVIEDVGNGRHGLQAPAGGVSGTPSLTRKGVPGSPIQVADMRSTTSGCRMSPGMRRSESE